MLKFSTLLTALMFLIVSSVIAQDTLTNKKDKSQQRIGFGLARRGIALSASYEKIYPKGFIVGIDAGWKNMLNGNISNGACIHMAIGYQSLKKRSLSINHTIGLGYNYSSIWLLNNNITYLKSEYKFGGPPMPIRHFFHSTLLTEFQFRVTERFSISPEIVLFVVPQGRDYYPIVLPFASLNFSFKI